MRRLENQNSLLPAAPGKPISWRAHRISTHPAAGKTAPHGRFQLSTSRLLITVQYTSPDLVHPLFCIGYEGDNPLDFQPHDILRCETVSRLEASAAVKLQGEGVITSGNTLGSNILTTPAFTGSPHSA